MTTAHVLGTLAAGASLVFVLVGLPIQILKNKKRKSCEGLALSPFLFALVSYSLWAAYGFASHDYFLAYSQTPGSFFVLIILLQFFIYRKQKNKEV